MHKSPEIKGIHHITAITPSAAANLNFYEQVLRLRLVKKTVNFDDPFTYHLYYGDAAGTPGTVLTFFEWAGTASGRPGAGMIAATAFAVPRDAIDFWRRRLNRRGIEVRDGTRFDEPLLRFKDPHGLPLELIGVAEPPAYRHPPENPVDEEVAVRGFHSATALLPEGAETQVLMTKILGMKPAGSDGMRRRFRAGSGPSPGCCLDLVVDPDARAGEQGGGTVHHIAFRAKTDADQQEWQVRLREEGFRVTDIRDRKYFRSIYFHEPGGILFEIATESPGFTVDETEEQLGRSLKLPEQYEPMRDKIVSGLPPLRVSRYHQVL